MTQGSAVAALLRPESGCSSPERAARAHAPQERWHLRVAGEARWRQKQVAPEELLAAGPQARLVLPQLLSERQMLPPLHLAVVKRGFSELTLLSCPGHGPLPVPSPQRHESHSMTLEGVTW